MWLLAVTCILAGAGGGSGENHKLEFLVIWISLNAGLLALYTDLLVNSPGIFGMVGSSV